MFGSSNGSAGREVIVPISILRDARNRNTNTSRNVTWDPVGPQYQGGEESHSIEATISSAATESSDQSGANTQEDEARTAEFGGEEADTNQEWMRVFNGIPNPSASNIQEEANTDELDGEEAPENEEVPLTTILEKDEEEEDQEEEQQAAELGGEESDITTQVVTSTAVEVSFLVFLSLSSFLSMFGRLAHIDLLNRFILFLTFYTKPVNQHSCGSSF